MPESPDQETSLKSATDSLSDQTKKLEIANYFTHGNFENAKKMVSGSYKDLYVIKAKFSSSSVYGAFLIFFNNVYQTMTDYFGIVSYSFTVDDIKTNVDWKTYEKEIDRNLKLKEHDDVLGNHMKEELANGFTIPFGNELKNLLDQNEEIGVNHLFQKLTQDRLGFPNVQISVDYDQITSLDMELHSISNEKIKPEDLKDKSEDKEKDKLDSIESLEGDDNDPLSGKNVKLILDGGLLLAPIKGTEISTLSVGDRIKVKIQDKNPKGISLAKAFNAYNDGKMLPISGRIVSIKNIPTGGYKIFVIVAKGIFLRVEEEEEGIKVAMDDVKGANGVDSLSEGAGISIPVIIILVVTFFVLIGVIFFFIV